MSAPAKEHVTQILNATTSGDPRAAEQLLPLVYEELRVLAEYRMAREPANHTLQPTALVHEAYMRLVGSHEVDWDGRGHFFAAAARAMRQILVNRALRRSSLKHGGGRARMSIDEIEPEAEELPAEKILALHEALERFQEYAPRQAKVVMLRYFAGLSVHETAKALGGSFRTVERDWRFARAWLHREMTIDDTRRE